VIAVGDTSAVIAAFNSADGDHHVARTAVLSASYLVISALTLHEVEHVMSVRVNLDAAYAVNDWLLAQDSNRRAKVACVDGPVLRRARQVQNRYRALRLDLPDAVNVVLAEHYETEVMISLDRRDYRAIRPLNGAPCFRLLPDDL
jgi:predicted nucleic acid-binding protein